VPRQTRSGWRLRRRCAQRQRAEIRAGQAVVVLELR
jgi:hypothetical protein